MLSNEKHKRADELIVANKELAFQNNEKEKRAAELVVANKELMFQNEEKEKRAAELVLADKELAFQNDEKEKRADELVIAQNANYIDFLTQCNNRRKFFIDIYKGVIQNDMRLTMMDFNNFKLINDEFGHKRGDEVLIFFSKVLTKRIARFNGVLYRLGGDEFAILTNVNSGMNIDEIFSEINQQLKAYHKESSIAYGDVIVTKENCNEHIPAEDSMKKADDKMFIKKRNQKTKEERNAVSKRESLL